jgi:nocturnin
MTFLALGTQSDNLTRCHSKALDWKTRRFRMLEEIARHNPDIICLQEVDNFEFLRVKEATGTRRCLMKH